MPRCSSRACGTRSCRWSSRSRPIPSWPRSANGSIAAAGPSLPPGPPEAVAAYLAAEQRLGRVRADIDPRDVASILLAVLFALGTMPTLGDEGPGPDRVASAVRLMVRGIQPPEPGR